MMWGGTLVGRSFTKWRDPTMNTKNTKGNHERKHSRTSPITHPLDNQTHKITRYMNNKGKDTWVEFISKRRP